LSTVKRIRARLPEFYIINEKSIISLLIQCVSQEFNVADKEILRLLEAHFVDSAIEDDLERIGAIFGTRRFQGESDEYLRKRLKRTVDEYKSIGGTVPVIYRQIKNLINAEEGDIEIIENLPVKTVEEFSLIGKSVWFLGSNSIDDEQPSISITVENGEKISNFQLTNTGTKQSIIFKGKLIKGQKLTIEATRSLLDEEDARPFLIGELPTLTRKPSKWEFALFEEQSTMFDDDNTGKRILDESIPTVKISYEWTRRPPAAFTVRVKEKAILKSGISVTQLGEMIQSVKACGVKANVEITSD